VDKDEALKREWQSLTDEEIEAIGKDDKVLLAQFHTSVKAIDEMKDPTAQIMNLRTVDKDAEIKRLNEKIEFLARTNMVYSDWEHRETQVTSDLIRKGIEEHKINAELRAEIERLKQREWVGLTDEEYMDILKKNENNGFLCFYNLVEAKLREKNTC
jgi:hypothetical protein